METTIDHATTGVVVRTLLKTTTRSSSASSSLLSTMLPRSDGNGVLTLAWSSDSSMLAGLEYGPAYGYQVVIWNVSTGQIMSTFADPGAYSLAWSSDDNYLASVSGDVVTVRNVHTGQIIAQHNVHGSGGSSLSPSLIWTSTGLPLVLFNG